MICAFPISSHKTINGQRFNYEYPCGQCLPCRITKRQEWTGRILLESLQHEENWFITLTYSNENLPADGSLSKRDLQLFFKRLRKRLGRFRYFAVGEYGTRTKRAHYHAIIFGLSSRYFTDESLSEIWGKGFTTLSEFTSGRAEYAANYTTKKIANWNSEANLDYHTTPEFAVMSRKPAIGSWVLESISKALHINNQRILTVGDTQITFDQLQTFRFNGKVYPLGKTFKAKIQEYLGTTELEKFSRMDYKHQEYLEYPELRAERLDKQRQALKNAQRTKQKIRSRQQL